jgi:hypothetical protein
MTVYASADIPPIEPDPLDPPILPPDDPHAPDVIREPSIDPPPTVPPVDEPFPPGTHPIPQRALAWQS